MGLSYMKISIKRERWVITRNDNEIFCGLARSYGFRPSNDLGNTAIKTYLSKGKAIASFNRSWDEDYDDNIYKAVPVIESVEQC